MAFTKEVGVMCTELFCEYETYQVNIILEYFNEQKYIKVIKLLNTSTTV